MVTGATRRIGRAVAVELARAGCALTLTYRTDPVQAKQTVQLCQEAGASRAAAVALDLNDTRAIEEFGEQMSTVDVLVHNAAVYERRALADLDEAHVWEQMRVNSIAPLLLTKACLGALLRSPLHGGAAVICFSDIHAMGRPRSGFAAYSMSKAAITEMVRSLAVELAPRVRVNGIAPGALEWSASDTAEERERYISRIPLGRAGAPVDAAQAVRWLALEATYITGQIIAIDGGRSLR